MNVITKSGNLAPYLRGASQVVANSVKFTAPVNVSSELNVASSFDVSKTQLNNSLAAQTSIVGGEYHKFRQNLNAQNAFFCKLRAIFIA